MIVIYCVSLLSHLSVVKFCKWTGDVYGYTNLVSLRAKFF